MKLPMQEPEKGIDAAGSVVWKYWTNRKHGTQYEVVGEAIAATNSREGEIDVIYTRHQKVYTRERSEFLRKFEPWHDK